MPPSTASVDDLKQWLQLDRAGHHKPRLQLVYRRAARGVLSLAPSSQPRASASSWHGRPCAPSRPLPRSTAIHARRSEQSHIRRAHVLRHKQPETSMFSMLWARPQKEVWNNADSIA
jgi:hypothetical protein